MTDSWSVRSIAAPDYADYVSHNMMLHDRLLLAVITDRDGTFVKTQIAVLSEGDDLRPTLRDLAFSFVEEIGELGEAIVASHAVDVREMFADTLVRLFAEQANDEIAALLARASEAGF